MANAPKTDLQQALESWGVDPAELADDRRSLLGDGLLDSLALFNLSIWLEERLGRPIDPARFDVATEWDSVDSILRFIARHSEGAEAPAVATVPPAPAATSPRPASPALAAPADERYRIVRYSDAYRADVARLMCGLWSPDATLNDAVFRWKYEDNPFAGEPLIYLALRDGRPVAIRAFCRSAWECDGAAGAQAPYVADDFVVAEEDRNHGLFNRFTEAALADLRARGDTLFLSLSALRVTRLQLLASGSRSVGVLQTIALRPAWLRLLDRFADAAQRTPLLWRVAERLSMGASARRCFDLLDAVEHPLERDGVQVTIGASAPADELAALVERLGHDGRLRHRRDARFFTWRYRHPLHAYRVLAARRGGRLVGYVVLQRGLSAFANPRRINVVDWAHEDAAVFATLLSTARDVGRIADLVTWASGTEAEAREFRRLGFRAVDQHQAERGLPCVLVRSVADVDASPRLGAKLLLEPASWDLRMAYTSFA